MFTFNAIEKQKPFSAMKLLGLDSALRMVKFVCGLDSDSRLRKFVFSIEHDENGVMHLHFDNDGAEYRIAEGDCVLKLHDESFLVLSEKEFDARFQTRV